MGAVPWTVQRVCQTDWREAGPLQLTMAFPNGKGSELVPVEALGGVATREATGERER